MTRQTYTNEATGAIERWSAERRKDGDFDVFRAVWEAAPINDWQPPASADVFVARVGHDERGELIVQLNAPFDLTQTQMARGRVAVKREFRAQARAERP